MAVRLNVMRTPACRLSHWDSYTSFGVAEFDNDARCVRAKHHVGRHRDRNGHEWGKSR